MIETTLSQVARMMQSGIYGTYDADTLVKGVVIDSRQVQEGSMYVPMIGQKADGHSFIEQVAQKERHWRSGRRIMFRIRNVSR